MQPEKPETEAAEAILSGQAVTKQWLTGQAMKNYTAEATWKQSVSSLTGKPVLTRVLPDREERITWDEERGQWCLHTRLIPLQEALEEARNEGYTAGYSTACVTLRELITDLDARVRHLEQRFGI